MTSLRHKNPALNRRRKLQDKLKMEKRKEKIKDPFKWTEYTKGYNLQKFIEEELNEDSNTYT